MEFSLKYRSRIIIDTYRDWISEFDKVLDIGCGNAVVTEELRRHFGCIITGVDILDYRKRDIPFTLLTNRYLLPFEDSEFNVSMLNDSLHHCKDWQPLFREAIRVSRRVLIFEMEPTLTAKAFDRLINIVHNPGMEAAVSLRTLEEWKRYFRKDNLDFEYRKAKKPIWLYPVKHFAFNIIKKDK